MKKTMCIIGATVLVLLGIGVGVWWYISTNDMRRYVKETKMYRRIAEHQELEITVINQRVELAELKAEVAAKQAKQELPK